MKLGKFTALEPRTSPAASLSTNPTSELIKGLLVKKIRAAADRAPRSRQVHLGPSEIGNPCQRQLAYKLSGYPATNTTSDPWASIVGTATHKWLEDKALSGDPDWVTELRVTTGHPLVPGGSVDAFHKPSGSVVDHKILGKWAYDHYRTAGMSPKYRVQIHTYGYGLARAGFTVKNVAVACYLKPGHLDDLWVWSEPYDESIVIKAFERLNALGNWVELAEPLENPAQFRDVPRDVGGLCTYCPWLKPGVDTGAGCPGNLG